MSVPHGKMESGRYNSCEQTDTAIRRRAYKPEVQGSRNGNEYGSLCIEVISETGNALDVIPEIQITGYKP